MEDNKCIDYYSEKSKYQKNKPTYFQSFKNSMRSLVKVITFEKKCIDCGYTKSIYCWNTRNLYCINNSIKGGPQYVCDICLFSELHSVKIMKR